MTPAPIPFDEAQRLAALRSLLILDTPSEERFDRFIAFARQEFQVPIALLSLVDESRQWFKARAGIDACETTRDISFCGHAVHARSTLVVEDTLDDSRFADNPLVTGDPKIRFYAGAPLVMPSGHALGTLCLIDTRPRQLDATDLAILHSLRDLAVADLLSREPA